MITAVPLSAAKLAGAVLVCLCCLGCFCTARDALPAKMGERLKAVPEGSWTGQSPDGAREEAMEVGWDEQARAYVTATREIRGGMPILTRFVHLPTPPYYAVLVKPVDSDAVIENESCPEMLFLAYVQEGVVELRLPDLPHHELEELGRLHGVLDDDSRISGPPQAVLGFLDDLAKIEQETVIRYRYSY